MPLYNPEQGFISFIQRYSTKDGPGIRSTVFFKGCPLVCLWCSNPELIRSEPDLLYNAEKCVHCGTCISVCPQDALEFDKDKLIIVNRSRCNGCGACVDACLEGALELVGRLMGVDETTAELLKDRVFYQTSGGGVTFSGGEPLWQSGFVARVAKQLKAEGIHTALDTAGDVKWCRFEEVLDHIDLVLYDLKTADSGLHRQLTGRENDLILANLRLLAKRGVPLHIRLVVVPGLNDDPAEFRVRMEFIRELASVRQVDILPYHRYGAGKYARLGLEYPLKDLPELDDSQAEALREQAAAYGIPATIGG